MKLVFSWLLLISSFVRAQENAYLTKLQNQLQDAGNDTSKILALYQLADYYGFNKFDSGFRYARQVIDWSEKIHYPIGEYLGLRALFFSINSTGNYPNALDIAQKKMALVENIPVPMAGTFF